MGCVGHVDQNTFYVGYNFTVVCVGQIYFCMGLCVGQNILRGSKIFVWVGVFFCMYQLLFTR